MMELPADETKSILSFKFLSAIIQSLINLDKLSKNL